MFLPFMDWALKEFRNRNFPGKTNCAKKGMTMTEEKYEMTKEELDSINAGAENTAVNPQITDAVT